MSPTVLAAFFSGLVVGIMFVSGCAPVRVTRLPVHVSDVSPVELVERNNKNLLGLKTLKALTTLNLESTRSANQFSAQVAIRMPDSVYIKIEGVLGIDGVKASLNSTTFIVYNILNKQVITGRTSAEAIRKTLDYDVSFDEMVELLLGWPTLRRDELDRLTDFVAESSQYVLTFRDEQGTRKVWVDPYSAYAVTRIDQVDERGELVVQKEFTRFEEIDGVMLPRYVRIFRPAEKDLLSIYFDSRSLNKNLGRRIFTIEYPAGVDVTHIE